MAVEERAVIVLGGGRNRNTPGCDEPRYLKRGWRAECAVRQRIRPLIRREDEHAITHIQKRKG